MNVMLGIYVLVMSAKKDKRQKVSVCWNSSKIVEFKNEKERNSIQRLILRYFFLPLQALHKQ